jgi:CheY-like chemotaxis protein
MATAARTSNILVVDDDRTTRHLTRTTLAKAGYAVSVAQDGAEALTRMRAKKFDPGAPRRVDAAHGRPRRPRPHETSQTRPRVVVMTSDDAPQTVLKAIRRQAYQYLHKPVEPAALVSIVRDALKSAPEPPIEVVSARPDWVELVVPCTREAADRLHAVMAQLETDLPEEVRESVGYAFRELLMNAVEWGRQARSETHGENLLPARQAHAALSHRRPRARFFDGGPRPLPRSAIPTTPIEHMEVRESKGLRPGGFGILMVKAKVDELIYNEGRTKSCSYKYLGLTKDPSFSVVGGTASAYWKTTTPAFGGGLVIRTRDFRSSASWTPAGLRADAVE